MYGYSYQGRVNVDSKLQTGQAPPIQGIGNDGFYDEDTQKMYSQSCNLGGQGRGYPYSGGVSNEYPGGYQQQKQVYNPQLIKQKQDEVLCTQGLGRLLNAAEDYAGKVKRLTSGSRKYGSYDTYNNNYQKSIERMKMEFMTHINLFKVMYDDYTSKNGSFKFPKNLPKEAIIQDIKKFKAGMSPQEADIYDSVIALLNGQNIPDYYPVVYDMEKGNPRRGQIDPHYAAKTAPKIRNTFDQINDGIEQHYIANAGNVGNEMVINGIPGSYLNQFKSVK